MLKELSEALQGARQRRASRGGYGGSIIGILEDASRNNKLANQELVDACVKLVKQKTKGLIKMQEFLEGCDYVDQVANVLNRK